MPDEKKKFKNLSTYAVIMILAVIILIIIAAMADDREEQFENQINEKEQTNMSIQNEIVSLKDENYMLKKENDQLGALMEENEKKLTFYTVMTEAWSLYTQGKKEEAAAKLSELNPERMDETEKAHYDLLSGLAAAETPPQNTEAPAAE